MTAVVLPRTVQHDIVSRSGKPYRVFMNVPDRRPDVSGYPVLYLLDGNATFPTAAVSLALQAARPETTGVSEAVVVGLGYPGDDYVDAGRRTYDYTPPIPSETLIPRRDGSAWPQTGGADRFLDFIDGELQPFVASLIPVDRHRQALFGHSFGGLLVLHALFTRPDLFRSYIAASPSIWFADRKLGDELQDFCEAKRSLDVPRRLLMTVGEQEQAQHLEGSPVGDRCEANWRRHTRMVENAKNLAERISSLAGSRIQVSYNEFKGENHASVLPAAISRALRFALASES